MLLPNKLFAYQDTVMPLLPTILGAVRGEAGSIGKSTMMLIIDFVFDGDTYVDSDAVRELPEHAINFTFEFDGASYNFVRRPHEPKVVVNIDSDGSVLKTLDLKEFTDWLTGQYDMQLLGASFRQMISRFFRIYGKNNHNELKPLQTHGGTESQKDAIGILIALFDYYKEIEDFKHQLQEAENRIAAFKAARRYEFIPSAVEGMTKYKQNIVEIAALELERLLNDIRRQIKTKQDELHLLNLNIKHGAYPTEADLKSLQDFFPEVNLTKLVEIEKFHTKIQTILSEELQETLTQVTQALKELKVQEARLISQMDAIPPSKAFTQEFLDAYTSLDRRINKLQSQRSI